MANKRYGRKTPYTAKGIRRLPCYRCGAPACQQWNVCADGGLYRPICIECDIKLNRLVLRWMGFHDEEVRAKMKKYVKMLDV